MARYAIDPPTLLRLVEGHRQVNTEHQIVAPNSIRTQALELLLGRVNSGQLSEASALAMHERMTELKMRLLGDRVSRRAAWDLASKRGWATLRDAEYLAVALLQADALVTIDRELANKAKGVVPLAAFKHLVAP